MLGAWAVGFGQESVAGDSTTANLTAPVGFLPVTASNLKNAAIPTCSSGYVLTSTGSGFLCTAENSPPVPPSCGGGYALTYNGSAYSCVNSVSGSSGSTAYATSAGSATTAGSATSAGSAGYASTAGYANSTGSIDLSSVGLPGWPQAILCNNDYVPFYRITGGLLEYDNIGGTWAEYNPGSRARVAGSASCPGNI